MTLTLTRIFFSGQLIPLSGHRLYKYSILWEYCHFDYTDPDNDFFQWSIYTSFYPQIMKYIDEMAKTIINLDVTDPNQNCPYVNI